MRVLAILESPYSGDIEANVAYARQCMVHMLRCNISPIASHLLYTQPGVLNDADPQDRALGINAGIAWRRVADITVFCAGRGWSRGMLDALAEVKRDGHRYMVLDGVEP